MSAELRAVFSVVKVTLLDILARVAMMKYYRVEV
jgi:hypothetical protein